MRDIRHGNEEEADVKRQLASSEVMMSDQGPDPRPVIGCIWDLDGGRYRFHASTTRFCVFLNGELR